MSGIRLGCRMLSYAFLVLGAGFGGAVLVGDQGEVRARVFVVVDDDGEELARFGGVRHGEGESARIRAEMSFADGLVEIRPDTIETGRVRLKNPGGDLAGIIAVENGGISAFLIDPKTGNQVGVLLRGKHLLYRWVDRAIRMDD